MVPSDFRLDTVSVRLVERLEGARRSYLDRPEQAPQAFGRIAEEFVAGAAAEAAEYADGAEFPTVLRREILETFLPRYTRLALEHNALERGRFGAWRGGDPLARVVGGGAAAVAAILASRFLPAPLAAIAWAFALSVALLPELRAIWFRRRYQRDLQALVDDMGRIQDNLEHYQPRAQVGASPDGDAERAEQRAALRAARAAASRAKE